jgi:N-dimethylarginine dimethylaminohydrolase
MKAFDQVLMVDPKYFQVEYAINPYMRDSKGALQKVNSTQARIEWEKLKKAYEKLNYTVSVLPGQAGLPDMVFAANQAFPFWKSGEARPLVLMSEMRSEKRKSEVQFFEKYFKQSDYQVLKLETKACFEGNGDILYHPLRKQIFGGYGPRTDKAVYSEVAERTGMPVSLYQLVNPNFYHLDTCFAILNEECVAVVYEAFVDEEQKRFEREFKNVIRISRAEALRFFAGNAHCPDGKHVLLHPGAEKFTLDLKAAGFTPVPVETGEYLKSGGSVFCLKMMCWK